MGACDCKPFSLLKKKKNKFSTKVLSKPPFIKRSSRRHRNVRFFRKKFQKSRKNDRCYLCKKLGHFAKSYPTKKEKFAKLISQFMINHLDSNLESLYSEQDLADKNIVFSIEDSSQEEDSPSEFSYSSDSDESSHSHIPIFMTKHTNSTSFPLQILKTSPQPVLLSEVLQPPHIQVTLLTSKFAKPLKAIGLIDIGAAKTMVNPDLFPADFWVKSKEQFQVANSEVFGASISRHKLGIKFFPDCLVWLHVYGYKLHGKDILIGWDCYCKAKHLRLFPTGL
jgi:hypothetical protein